MAQCWMGDSSGKSETLLDHFDGLHCVLIGGCDHTGADVSCPQSPAIEMNSYFVYGSLEFDIQQTREMRKEMMLAL